MTDVAGDRPYLEGPVDLDRTETLIEWARYLGRTFGTAGALAALRHYERLSWIDPAARRDVERHLRGLPLTELGADGEDASVPAELPEPLAGLGGTSFAAHARSLAFVALLAGDDLAADVDRATVARHRAGSDVADPDATGLE
jgi:archaellum component FlaD/FlaE